MKAMGIYPTSLSKLPPTVNPRCEHCGAPPPEEYRDGFGSIGYVYYVEGENWWIHRGCVHQFLKSAKAKDLLDLKVPITIGDEGAS